MMVLIPIYNRVYTSILLVDITSFFFYDGYLPLYVYKLYTNYKLYVTITKQRVTFFFNDQWPFQDVYGCLW